MPPAAITMSASITLDAPPERLWPFLSDTDRVNRLIGLPASEQVEPQPDLSRTINGHYLGVPVTWREYPFEWAFEQWFAIDRVFDAPIPVSKLRTITALTALPDDHTRIDVTVITTPRNLLGRLGAKPVIGRRMVGDLLRVYGTIGTMLKQNATSLFPMLRTPMVDQGRLMALIGRLRQTGSPEGLVDRLSEHLASADDPEVLRMRPFALADRWRAPRLEVLRLFLHATRVGLLDLEWDVMCPNCRGASLKNGSLAGLGHDAHCASCNIRYDLDFDKSVELRFSVAPALRMALDATYCVGGPANTRHIAAQLWLQPGERRELELRLRPGGYRVRSPQLPYTTNFDVADVLRTQQIGLTLAADQASTTHGDPRSSDQTALNLTNAASAPVLTVIEETSWSDQAASASLVTALEDFRQLFSSEVLTPGVGLAVRSLTFLFSDLKGSTAIYDHLGDAPAYARVRDHFAVMRGAIAAHNGALVKTIGDAVMAVFPVADDAVRAAFVIQQEFTHGPIGQNDPMLRVKLGIHRGACIAVNANDLLDYFGSTVNIAARVQNESVGGDIMITDEVFRDPGVQQVLAEEQPEITPSLRMLKGVSQEVALHQIWPQRLVPATV